MLRIAPFVLSTSSLLGQPFFWFALFAGPAAVCLLDFFDWVQVSDCPSFWLLVKLILVMPVLEEWVFRGNLQGWLAKKMTGAVFGLSYANYLTSAGFALLHLLSQPVLWAAAVFLPSLVFGWCADQAKRLEWPIIFHSYYNGCFILWVYC